MIHTEAIVFNAFQVNTYLVWDETGACLVVDPAFYSKEEQHALESLLSVKGLYVAGQINTHCHVDHVLGVHHMKSEYKCAFRAHHEESKVTANVPLMGDLFGWSVEPINGIDEFIEDNQLIPVGNHSLQAIHVPGHSMGSLAFYSRDGGFVITGDALFRGSIGRTDLPGGDYNTLINSINNRLLVLPPETVVFPGHGPSSTIGEETGSNPFLRTIL
ncbi:MAG: MBL fold metallo-hydrolase [Bacteroidota bacterium]